MRRFLLVGLLVVLAVPAVAHAQFRLGARVAYAVPMGYEAKDSKMSDGVKGAVPIEIDLTYDVTSAVSLGLYGSYAFVRMDFKSNGQSLCDTSGISCSGSGLRFGVQGNYFAPTSGAWSPWLGAQIGYEKLSFSIGASDRNLSSGYDSGFEFLTLQAGLDCKVSPMWRIGPFASIGFGQYSHARVEGLGQTVMDGEIDRQAVHQWLQFGLRGVSPLRAAGPHEPRGGAIHGA